MKYKYSLMKPIRPSLIVLFSMFFIGNCFGVTKSFPEKRYFLIEAGPFSATYHPPKGSSLKLRRFAISQKFEGKEFVYRKDNVNYESDFYHSFFIPPSSNLKEEIVKGLIKQKNFEWDGAAQTRVDPTHFAEVNVQQLYGDFRSNQPAAVMEIEFLFYSEKDGNTQILLRKTFTKTVSIQKKEPEALVLGWNDALTQILNELGAELSSKVN
ncbi:ABC-type transport auxiliary lipoprotein, LBF_0736 family [Leptospira idonii]|nr:hypothetical protein [Leptospira idonii]